MIVWLTKLKTNQIIQINFKFKIKYSNKIKIIINQILQ